MARYAIMGTNYLSHIYRKAICDAGDQVVAVCSRDLERAKELGGEGEWPLALHSGGIFTVQRAHWRSAGAAGAL